MHFADQDKLELDKQNLKRHDYNSTRYPSFLNLGSARLWKWKNFFIFLFKYILIEWPHENFLFIRLDWIVPERLIVIWLNWFPINFDERIRAGRRQRCWWNVYFSLNLKYPKWEFVNIPLMLKNLISSNYGAIKSNSRNNDFVMIRRKEEMDLVCIV